MATNKTLSAKLPIKLHENFVSTCKVKGITPSLQVRKWVENDFKNTSTLILFGSIATGLPVGIFTYNKIKKRMSANGKHTQIYINRVSTFAGISVGVTVTFLTFRLLRVLL